MNTICDELFTSEKIKKILGIILACGNSMNASNKTRGDADGFDLAILPSLKDVKSKDNTTNLLQYISYYYVSKFDDDGTKLPLPDASDFSFVAQVSFEDIEKEIGKIKKELKEVEERVENVLKAEKDDTENGTSLVEPFKTKINEFLTKASDECKEQEEIYIKCKLKFQKTINAFMVKPRSSDNEVTPNYYFTLWAGFSQDFKNAWKREIQKITKLK